MDKKDKLEKFIIENRASFDTYKAPDDLWLRIENQLDDKRFSIIRMNWIYGLAAAIAVLIFAVFGMTQNFSGVSGDRQEFIADADFTEAQQYFITQVNEKWSQLQELHTDETLEEDLRLLDVIENELRLEYQQAQDEYKSVILDALINNYQTKLSLLQKIIREVKEESTRNIYHDM